MAKRNIFRDPTTDYSNQSIDVYSRMGPPGDRRRKIYEFHKDGTAQTEEEVPNDVSNIKNVAGNKYRT